VFQLSAVSLNRFIIGILLTLQNHFFFLITVWRGFHGLALLHIFHIKEIIMYCNMHLSTFENYKFKSQSVCYQCMHIKIMKFTATKDLRQIKIIWNICLTKAAGILNIYSATLKLYYICKAVTNLNIVRECIWTAKLCLHSWQ